MKTCGTCNQLLSLTKFHKNSNKSGLYSICKTCRAKNRSILTDMLSNAKKRAKKKGWKFDLTKEFLIQLNQQQNGLCAYTGVLLNWNIIPKKQRVCPPDRVSLDRIDSLKGYTKDNVCLVADIVNRIKLYHTNEDMVKFCRLIVDKMSGPV